MYKKSIKEVRNYLLPFIEGMKYYDSNDIEHGLGTMMVLNKNGDFLTCKHIAVRILLNNELREIYSKLLSEIDGKDDKEIDKIFNEYGLNKEGEVLTKIEMPFSKEGVYSLEIKLHDYLDIALIRVTDAKMEIDNYPIFSERLPEIGQSVCKIGYAFPEYNIFEYSEEEKKILTKKNVSPNFPLFPIDGIVTRHVMDEKHNLSMFETSTPGIRGQSGGPIFDSDGLVFGMQSYTKHIDLNFDIDQEVKRGSKKKKVTYTPFINLGVGVSSVEIIKFLKDNNVEFQSR